MKIRESGLPFDDFRTLLGQLPPVDENALNLTKDQVAERMGAKPTALGGLCEWYAGWSGRSPAISRPVLTLFAGTHAVDRSGEEYLLTRIEEIASGGSAVNRVCHQNDVGLKVLDLALQIPVADITMEPALDEKSCAGTIAFGMEAIAGGTDLLCAAAVETVPNVSCLAMLAVLYGVNPHDMLHSDQGSIADTAQFAVKTFGSRNPDGLEVLRWLGGRETAAICGAILAARSQHIPVLLAGPSALTCAAILEKLAPGAAAHCRLAQTTGIPALDTLAGEIGLEIVISDFATDNPAIQLGIAAGWMRSAGLVLAG